MFIFILNLIKNKNLILLLIKKEFYIYNIIILNLKNMKKRNISIIKCKNYLKTNLKNK